MPVNIDITVNSNSLRQLDKEKRNILRLKKIKEDKKIKVKKETNNKIKDIRSKEQLDTNGKPKTTAQEPKARKDEPAAWRGGKRGIFGLLVTDEAFTPDDQSDPDPVFKDNRITDDDKIKFSSMKNGKYGVIRIGSISRCLGYFTEPSYIFLGRELELKRFLKEGGVLWVNSEYIGCAIRAASLNSYMRNLFGCTVAFDDNRAFLKETTYKVFKSRSDKFPSTFDVDTACSISGGVPMYSASGNCACAYERIGKGYLVLSGDSNGTAQFPGTTEDPGLFIEALREL